MLPAALALVVFLGWLGRRDVVTSHEARVGQTARVMAASGWPWAARPVDAAAIAVRGDPDGSYAVPRYDVPPMRVNPWLVPVLGGRARLQKPPLPNWCAAVLYRSFGVSEWTTRIVPALLAAFATLLVADLARMLLGRAATWPAALVWAGMFAVVSECRHATPDAYLMFFTLAAVWAWMRASEPTARGRAGPLIGAFYASLGLGVLAKGPFIFVHVGIAIAAYALCCRRRPRASRLSHAVGICLLLAIALPWPLYVATRVRDVALLWEMEATRGGGATLPDVLSQSWRYLPRLLEVTLPWTPIWLAGVATVVAGRWRRPRGRRRWFPVVWTAATVAVFSLSPEKKTAYLLPMMPAQALLVVTGVRAATAGLRRGRRSAHLTAGAQGAVGMAGVVAAVVMLWGRADRTDVAAAVVIGGAALLLLFVGMHRARVASSQPGARRWLAPQAVGCALACLLVAAFARAAKDNERSAKPFAAAAGPVMLPPAKVLVPGLPEEAVFYLPLELEYDPRARQLYDAVEPPRRGPLDVSKMHPTLPHGRVVRGEIVDLPGERAETHWRLVRWIVEPDNVTSPALPATSSSIRR